MNEEKLKKQIDNLETELSEARQENARLIRKYDADCLSCKNREKGAVCQHCSVAKKSRYEVVEAE
jgi:hypothetical protein